MICTIGTRDFGTISNFDVKKCEKSPKIKFKNDAAGKKHAGEDEKLLLFYLATYEDDTGNTY